MKHGHQPAGRCPVPATSCPGRREEEGQCNRREWIELPCNESSNALSGKQAVPLEEVVLAQAFELEALLNVLERKGIVANAEVLEEIKRLREKAGKGR